MTSRPNAATSFRRTKTSNNHSRVDGHLDVVVVPGLTNGDDLRTVPDRQLLQLHVQGVFPLHQGLPGDTIMPVLEV